MALPPMAGRGDWIVGPSYPATQELVRQSLLCHSWEPDHRSFGVGPCVLTLGKVPTTLKLMAGTFQRVSTYMVFAYRCHFLIWKTDNRTCEAYSPFNV